MSDVIDAPLHGVIQAEGGATVRGGSLLKVLQSDGFNFQANCNEQSPFVTTAEPALSRKRPPWIVRADICYHCFNLAKPQVLDVTAKTTICAGELSDLLSRKPQTMVKKAPTFNVFQEGDN